MLRILRHYHSASGLLLFCVETLAAGVAACGSYYFLFGSTAFNGVGADGRIAGFFAQGLIIATIMYSVGLYERPHHHDLPRVMARLTLCLAIAIPILMFISDDLLAVPFQSSRQLLLFYSTLGALVVGGVLASRLGHRAIVRVMPAQHRVLVVGVGHHAAEIESLVANEVTADVVVGFYSLKDEGAQVSAAKILPPATSLLDTIHATHATELIVALDDRRGAPLRALLDARMTGVTVTSYLSFWERTTRRINLANLEPGWLIYSDGFRVGSFANTALKRLLDIATSLSLLIITFPILLATAIAIRLEGRGPILYSQERVGRNGVVFRILKFRTMRPDAESGAPQWATSRDPRVTRVGHFLRLARIDELPQLYNVLKGDMSLVGPRPERPFFVESLARSIPYYSERHRVRPGITGWAQIKYPYGASIEDAKEKLSFDLYYIKNFSILLDLLILLATIQTVLWKKGAR